MEGTSSNEHTKMKLVLGSQSPRRQELIAWLDIPFVVITSDVEEESQKEDPVLYCEDIARLKGGDVWAQACQDHENPLVVSADTMVFVDNLKLGKPKDHSEAIKMLRLLSGRGHQVVTSVFMKLGKEEHTFSVVSDVTFDKIDDVSLKHYLASGESMDKAGAYGIQGKGLMFISHLNGSYSNVVGFPLSSFKNELRSFIKADDDHWRKRFV